MIDQRPGWMREGQLRAALVEGHQSLNVVGESHYQDNLWRIVGGRRPPEEYVHQGVHALLVADENNPYDANAVSVRIDGLKVGHLSREDAQRLRPGLLALQQEHGQPFALTSSYSRARF